MPALTSDLIYITLIWMHSLWNKKEIRVETHIQYTFWIIRKKIHNQKVEILTSLLKKIQCFLVAEKLKVIILHQCCREKWIIFQSNLLGDNIKIFQWGVVGINIFQNGKYISIVKN